MQTTVRNLAVIIWPTRSFLPTIYSCTTQIRDSALLPYSHLVLEMATHDTRVMPPEGIAFISRIPEEVLRMIVVLLRRKDLKKLRQMDRKINRVASGALFRSIQVHDDKSSQSQLKHITASSWRLQVRTFDWYISADVKSRPSDLERHFATHWHFNLVRALPALHTVRFRGAAVDLTWDRRFKWENDLSTERQANWGSEARFRYDLYHPIQVTEVRPTTVEIGFTRIYLTYTPSHEIIELHAQPFARKLYEENWQWRYISRNAVADPKSEVRERHSHQSQQISSEPFPNDLILFQGAATSHRATLKKVMVYGISVYVGFLEDLLANCPMLEEMTLNDVLLTGDHTEGHEIQVHLLESLKQRQTRSGLSNVHTDFIKMYVEGYEGSMTASNGEITTLLQEDEKTWFATFQASFQPMSEPEHPDSPEYDSDRNGVGFGMTDDESDEDWAPDWLH